MGAWEGVTWAPVADYVARPLRIEKPWLPEGYVELWVYDGFCVQHMEPVGRYTGLCYSCHLGHFDHLQTLLDADSRGVEAGSFRRPERSSSSRSLSRFARYPMGEPLPKNAATEGRD